MALFARRRLEERPGPLDYHRRLFLRLIFAGSLVFLYAPIITLIIFSFLARFHAEILRESPEQ